MKKIIYVIGILLMISSTSCINEREYPVYSLDAEHVVPDSLLPEYREWITETVRAASQHMSAGDYEDVNRTIRQAAQTGEDIFGTRVIRLSIQVDSYDFYYVQVSEMNETQLKIFNELMNTEIKYNQ